MSTGIQGTPVWKDPSKFYNQYAQEKENFEKICKSNKTKQGDLTISLGNGLAIKISIGASEERHKYRSPKIATLTIDRGLGNRWGKSFHEGDYPIFASFTYKNRRDLFKQVSLFMQGIRSKENKQENNFEQQVLEKCKSNIGEAQEELKKTSDPEKRQKITEQIVMFQQKAQRKYLDLQTFANSLPDDKGKNTGNATDKAEVNGILNKFSEFKPSVERTRTTLENYHNEIRVLKGQLKGADTEARKKMEADIKTLEGKAQGAYQDLQTFANSLPDDNGTNTGDATDKADAQTLLDEFSEFEPSIDASPQPAVESSSKHPVKNFFKNLFKRA